MRKSGGFTLLEMTISAALFAAGAVYVYATFSGVTRSSRTATVQMDLGSQNKRALTRLFTELQASSLREQDTDGLDSTEAEAVLVIQDDLQAPLPSTKARLVTRAALSAAETGEDGAWELGASREQARERTITRSKLLRFRKVMGYQFSADVGAIVPRWSEWVTYRVDGNRQLVRALGARPSRVVATRVDAFDVEAKPDGTVVVTTVTARRDPLGDGFRRYANSVTVHPKN
jgi:prepilin-type N-terminal cleavage/methylation domain-containing protein